MMFPQRLTIRSVLDHLKQSNASLDKNKINQLFSLSELDTPWYVHLLLVIGSWFGVLFIAIFIGWQLRSSTYTVYLTLGIILTVISIVVYRAGEESYFVRHLSLPISLLGLICLGVGLGDLVRNIRLLALCLLVSEVLVFAIHSDPVRRFICTFTTVVALAFLIYGEHTFYPIQFIVLVQTVVAIMVWEHQSWFLRRKLAAAIIPAMYGFVTGLLLFLITFVHRDAIYFYRRVNYHEWWLSTVILVLALLYLINRIHQRMEHKNQAMAILAGVLVIVVGALTYHSPGVLASLFVMLLAYAHGSRVLFYIANVFLIAFLSAYYYNLSVSLLAKSISLMASGAAFLVTAWFSRRLSSQKEA